MARSAFETAILQLTDQITQMQSALTNLKEALPKDPVTPPAAPPPLWGSLTPRRFAAHVLLHASCHYVFIPDPDMLVAVGGLVFWLGVMGGLVFMGWGIYQFGKGVVYSIKTGFAPPPPIDSPVTVAELEIHLEAAVGNLE